MDPKHAPEFEAHLIEVCDLYERSPPSAAALRIWWETLAPFDFEMIRDALTEHCATCKFTPRPADIVERLITADGRPDGDEAWSLALLAEDEAQTLVWTREITDAWGIARPVLATGDQIGARKTFLASYERLVTTARRGLVTATWTVSLGTAADGRVPAVAQAVRQGRLTRDHARTLLGPQERPTPAALECAKVAGLLTGKVSELPNIKTTNARRFLTAVRAGLEQADNPHLADRAARQLEQHAARERERTHRAAEVTRLATYQANQTIDQQGAA
jgi:hypothetical protein